jgi:cytochrome c oxidase subunit 3
MAQMSSSPRGGAQATAIYPAQVGMWIFVGTVTMLFAAFTSAYLIRRVSADWTPIHLPTILWANTAVLLASSLVLEWARSASLASRAVAAGRQLWVTALLGAIFLGGQLAAWRELVSQGVYIPTSPHSSFFYIFTGLHGLHLCGGLILLAWTARRATRVEPAAAQRLVRLCTTYWHFLGGLWLFLYLVLARL